MRQSTQLLRQAERSGTAACNTGQHGLKEIQQLGGRLARTRARFTHLCTADSLAVLELNSIMQGGVLNSKFPSFLVQLRAANLFRQKVLVQASRHRDGPARHPVLAREAQQQTMLMSVSLEALPGLLYLHFSTLPQKALIVVENLSEGVCNGILLSQLLQDLISKARNYCW